MRTIDMTIARRAAAIALVATVALGTAGCESGGGSGAGVGRAAFGNNAGAMLIGGAVGGLAGNMTVDRAAEDRRFQQQEATRDASAQRQLDFERQRMLQEDATQRQIQEQREFDEWRRQQRG
jgi:hypothetical protein